MSRENEYRHYENVTREILNEVKVGDLIKVNDWNDPMVVMAVSPNYFVMVSEENGESYYSVCSKIPWDGVRYNSMVGGMFYCGPDDWLLGSPLCNGREDFYKFKKPEWAAEYLQSFEDGESRVSERHGVAIHTLYIKNLPREEAEAALAEKGEKT